MTTHTNGRLSSIESDFRELRAQINAMHEVVRENEVALRTNVKHLDLIPTIAANLKTQTYIMAAMFAFLTLIVLIVIIKGTNLRLSIPGWLEINGNHEGVFQK